MSTIIIGDGFLANYLRDTCGYTHVKERISPSEAGIRSFLEQHKPSAIINCIAKTGRPNIDWCETHREETLTANVSIPTILANLCNRKGIQLIQIGSGCIFYGPSPSPNGWSEKDFANPRSYYSKTKYSCDLAIQDLENVCILRIRMPISKDASPRNYLSKIFAYDKVINVPNSMTFMDDLARAVNWAIDRRRRGVYHLTYPTPLTAKDFLDRYSQFRPDAKYTLITEEELERMTAAPRSNCILDSSKILNEGFEMSEDKESLIQNYVEAYVNATLLEKQQGAYGFVKFG